MFYLIQRYVGFNVSSDFQILNIFVIDLKIRVIAEAVGQFLAVWVVNFSF